MVLHMGGRSTMRGRDLEEARSFEPMKPGGIHHNSDTDLVDQIALDLRSLRELVTLDALGSSGSCSPGSPRLHNFNWRGRAASLSAFSNAAWTSLPGLANFAVVPARP